MNSCLNCGKPVKNKYCNDNGIKMIRIHYTIKFDDILPLLKNELGITG